MKPTLSMSGVLLALWIWLAAYLNVTGWLLSSFHQLNRTGYLVALAVFAAAVWKWISATGFSFNWSVVWRRNGRRYLRPLPAIYLGLTALVFVGGLLWAPTNYDAITYRLPRILNWLAAEHWLWIPTITDRMNFSGLAWEWLASPQFALFHTDRALFLINLVSFSLMPGLLFSIFRQLGMRRRVAWTWMWLLPLASGYIMQAGSVGNDLTGAIFCLASVHFGLRARKSGQAQDVWLALLAAALMTGIKLSNLPLALPCVVAVWPALPNMRRSLAKSFAVIGVSAIASALPIMVLNQLHVGDWGGDPQNWHQVQVKSPAAALLGNSLQLAQASLLPPVLPGALSVYQKMNAALPASWQEYLHREFPRYYLGSFQELASEEGGGLGLGFTICGVMILLLGLRRLPPFCWRSPATLIVLATLVAFAAYMLKMGSEATARLLLPYFPLLLLPLLKLPVQENWLRHRTWRLWLLLVALSVFPAIILSPARPLWPAQKVSQAWLEKHPDSQLAQRIATIYATYANRNDLLRPLREHLPPGAREVGLAAGSNDAEYSLWRPFGTRTVRCFWLSRDRQIPVAPGRLEWLIVHTKEWNAFSTEPLPEWAARHHFNIVATVPLVTFAKHAADDWCLLHLEKPPLADVMSQPH